MTADDQIVDAVALAESAAEQIRRLNHATLDPTALGPVEAYRVLGDLVSLLQRLPQTLEQLDRIASRWENVRSDRPDPDAADLYELRSNLLLARDLGAQHRQALSFAHQAASHLYIGVGS